MLTLIKACGENVKGGQQQQRRRVRLDFEAFVKCCRAHLFVCFVCLFVFVCLSVCLFVLLDWILKHLSNVVGRTCLKRVQILEERLPGRAGHFEPPDNSWGKVGKSPLSVIFTTSCFSLRKHLTLSVITLAPGMHAPPRPGQKWLPRPALTPKNFNTARKY